MEKTSIAKKKRQFNIILTIAIVAVMGFGTAFVYYAIDYYRWRRDGEIARENTEMAAAIFQDQMTHINWLINTTIYEPDTEYAAGVPVMTMSMETFDTSPLDEIRQSTGNADIVAFIYIYGTNVRGSVVQGSDNEFYLHRDVNGNRNVNGSLFLDYRNSPFFIDPNTIIYGHNMNNGTMFHNLRYYMQRDFFEAHPQITIITDNLVLIYDIFSVFQTRIDFDYIQVDFGEGEFAALISEITRRSLHASSVAADNRDNILILSTCTNTSEDSRMVVAARLARIIRVY